ncbi:MAG: hypothetical protein KGJ44_05025 [Betaproteobacteria bacterium]|nr:hypothetical protein [Betaproteobacteria bacterium]
MNATIRKLTVAAALSAAAMTGAWAATPGYGDLSAEDLHLVMVQMGMNKDGMVSKHDLMKKVEQAMKMADPKGKGMYDEAMMRKFFHELYGIGK